MENSVRPYKESAKGKKAQVAEMFNKIAPRYDFLNLTLSFGIDRLWRRKVVKKVIGLKPKRILDVACGTADLSIAVCKAHPEKVVGADISEEMMVKGREKVAKKGLDSVVELQYGDSENLPFESDHFDVATVAFGVRNFENPLKGLKEINRTLNSGGTLFVLEFSKPKTFPVKQFYHLYSFHILPFIGKLVSGDQSAYQYLPESIQAFPEGADFISLMGQAGFKDCRFKTLSFGIATIYEGKK